MLGGEQHGHIAAVGFDTYVRLLEQTVQELKGEEVPLEIHSTLNLGLDIRIPPEYIADEHQRLRAYKRIADAGDEEAARKILDELRDRYGDTPDVVLNLLQFSSLKSLSQNLGIDSIDRRAGFLNITFHKESQVDPARLMALVGGAPSRNSARLASCASQWMEAPAPPNSSISSAPASSNSFPARPPGSRSVCQHSSSRITRKYSAGARTKTKRYCFDREAV